MTTVRLAEALDGGRGGGAPGSGEGGFVPVFWMASDDHDLAEIDHVTILDRENHLKKIRVPGSPPEWVRGGKLPVSKVTLPEGIRECTRRLADLTHDSEFKGEILSHLEEAYAPGRTPVEAFARWMTHLFGRWGLVLIDGAHPDLKRLGKSVFYREVADGSPSTREALRVSKRLESRGYGLQVQQREGILNLFLAERERRTLLVRGGRIYVKAPPGGSRGGLEPGAQRERGYSPDELLSRIDEEPGAFSPNVLLRPIYQDALLPTVAYVAGPGEIAYYAQMKGIYESFGLPMPVIYPRKRLVLLEKKVDTILKKYDLKIEDFRGGLERQIDSLAGEKLPAGLAAALEAAASHIRGDFESLREETAEFDPTLVKSVEAARERIQSRVGLLEAKILRAAGTRSGIVSGQLQKAKNNLFPQDQPQERVFNITPYLFKYGPGLLTDLVGSLDMDRHEPQEVRL
jgi:bacillithiol biosynthesis cysteine-adding enzyme BshC